MRAGFVDRVRQRLLAIDVLAHLASPSIAADGVRVVGRADGDRVDLVAHLVEHLAEVVELALALGNLAAFVFKVLSSMSQMATTLPTWPA